MIHYLWKEWRDSRAVVAGFLLAFPLLQGVAALVLPAPVIGDILFATVSAAAGLGTAALAFAGDLIPGEARRGTLGFLARLPQGLGAAFLGKAAFLLLALGLFSGYALVGAWLVQALAGGATLALDERLSVFLPLAFCFALWIFAVSTWLPRGALALPAAALLLGLLFLPVVLIWQANPGLVPAPGADALFRRVLTAGALIVAWLCFVRGRRFGRGPGASAWRGLLATVVLFTPAWGYAALEARAYRHFDPQDEGFFIGSAYLGTGGRYVFANGSVAGGSLSRSADAPRHAFVVDLETGGWRAAGAPRDWFLPVGELNALAWKRWRVAPIPVVALCEASTLSAGRAWMRYYDGRTGERFKSGWSDLRLEEVERLGPRGPAHVPEGYAVVGNPRGLGFQVAGPGRGTRLFDPFRGEFYARPRRFTGILIRPGRWLARLRPDRRGWSPAYVLLDPDTLETAPAAGLTRVDWLMEDGRVVTVEGGRVAVVDPESGARRVLGVRAEATWSPARLLDGAYLVELRRGGRHRYARLDGQTLELTFFLALEGARFEPIAVEQNGSLLGIYGNRQIVRVGAGGDTRELLFPR